MSSDRNDSTPAGPSDRETTEPPEGWREQFRRDWKPVPDDDPIYQGGAQLFIVRRPRPTETDPKEERQ